MDQLNLFLTVITTPIFLAIIGLCVGSFINVVVWRLPKIHKKQWNLMAKEELGLSYTAEENPDRALTLSHPESHCPKCGHKIKAHENIPLLSWLFLKGRCSNCKSSISIKYPAVELMVGLVFMSLGVLYKEPVLILSWCTCFAFLISAALIDLDSTYLPDDLIYPVLWLGLGLNALNLNLIQGHAYWGVLIGYGVLWGLVKIFELLGKEALGYGDLKLLAAIGAWVGPKVVLVVIMLAFLLFIVHALSKREKGPMCFGPHIVSAFYLVVLSNPTKIGYMLPF